jgi:MOSC domain-containing protein YiiM
MIMGSVRGICISERRGTQKKEVEEAVFIKDWGIQDDAHAGKWHRQVSILSYEKIKDFQDRGANIAFGAFGENLIIEGYDFKALPIGTMVKCGSVLMEMTQIGKECHSHCEIYKTMGECIMPQEGVFARVLEGGTIRRGDCITVEAP